MMEKFQLSVELPVKASRVYNDWLSPIHGKMTQMNADIQPVVGSSYSVSEGYITGKILELEKDKRILHSWRTTEFPEDAPDSMLEVKFEDTPTGCRIHLDHWDIPEGQGKRYEEGWQEYYFSPMLSFYS